MSLFDSASLVLTPSGYKEDKLYSIKPTDGSGDLVVTRATTATRVNSAGLVELVPYNLFNYSQDLSGGNWSTFAASGTITRTANYATAPNGTTTATRIQNSGGTTVQWTYQNIFMLGSGVFSVYVKRTGSTNQTFRLFANNGASYSSNFTATAEWQRFEFSVGATSSALPFGLTTDSSGTAADILVWGMQLVTGSSAKEYFPTTDRLNVPRLDYTNSSCPSILVEPQRTNLLTYSEQFDNAVWNKQNCTITANTLNSPNGTNTADSLIASSGTATAKGLYLSESTSAPKSFSFFAKKGNKDWAVLLGYNGNNNVWFNISNGTIGTIGSNFINAKIENYGNGWYRCSATLNSSVAVLPNIGLYVSDSDNSLSCTGDGATASLYLWGAQLEAGTYATSYIPTVASSVTRNADVISKTGISSLIGQTEGTMFIDIVFPQKTEPSYIGISDGTTGNRIILGCEGDIFYTFGYGFSYLSLNTNTRYKIAMAYNSANMKIYANGNLLTTVTGSVPSGLSRFAFDSGGGSQNLIASVNTCALFKTKLSDSELATLTTI